MSELEVLTYAECMALLAPGPVGRIAVVVDGQPLILPVNYKLIARHSEEPVIVLRARPGGLISTSDSKCAFEVDGVDTATHCGWSVLVQGWLRHFSPSDPVMTQGWLDPHPWADAEQRTDWLLIVPTEISGRRVPPQPLEWVVNLRAYL